MQLDDQIKSVLSGIESFCADNNIDYKSITVAAATKTVPASIISRLKPLGISICGENRVQELLQKYDSVDTEWHFFGRLQTNKVKYLVDKITMLHSLDRIELAHELQKRLTANDIPVMDALIEVNIGSEDTKTGVTPQNAYDFYMSLKKFDRIRVRGLMSIPPVYGGKDSEKYYLQLKHLYDTIKDKSGSPHFNVLSAGMSGDYLTALSHGANFLRLGTVLFGERE